LTTLLLLKSGYAYVPYSSLESVIEENKEAYYLALRQTQGTIRTDAPNWQPWLVFFLQSLDKQVQRLEKKIEYEKLVLSALPELARQLVDFTKSQGRITIAEALTLTNAPRSTVKMHFKNLVAQGYFIKHGAARGVWYTLK
jgi:Fic family protein